MSTILNRVWKSYSKRCKRPPMGVAACGEFVNAYLRAAGHDHAAMEGAAAALHARSGASVPFPKLSASAKAELRAEALTVLQSLLAYETVELDHVRGNRWSATHTRLDGRSTRHDVVARSAKQATAAVISLCAHRGATIKGA